MPQAEIKDNLNGGLDLDTSYYKLAKNRYVDALNITRNAVEGSQDGVPTNIVSNRIIAFNNPAGTNKTIGSFPFQLRGTIIEFLYNSGGYNTVIECDPVARTKTVIFQSLTSSATDILNFSSTGKISSVNVYPNDDFGDLLFFIDTLGRPTVMNITRFKAGQYTPVTREIIDVIKAPFLSPPAAVYANDATRNVNNLRNKFFKFDQIPVYDDNEESVFSCQSAMPMPVKILDDTYTNVITNNNVITLSLNSGPKNVKAIRLLVAYVEKTNVWSDFATVEVINKAANSIGDDTVFSYSFYNDSTYPTYDTLRAIELFDRVPKYAECQDMANGNTLEFAGITEGKNRDITPNVVNTVSTIAAGSGGTIGSLNGVVTILPLSIGFDILFTGIPATGTTVTVRATNGVISIVATYVTIAGNVSSSVVNGLILSAAGIGILVASVGGTPETIRFTTILTGYSFSSLTITPPATGSTVNSIATWLWSTERNIALQYFGKGGYTNGVLYNAKIAFPAYAENGGAIPLLPYINTKIYHVPPDWAYSYTFLFTKEPTKPLFWHTIDVKINETDFYYFDVSNILLNATKNPTTANVLNYTFADGDRMRLIRRMSDGTVYPDTYDAPIVGLVVNPKIANVQTTGQFLKIRKVAPFTSVDYATKFFVIEIFRPGQQAATGKNETYFELGEQYAILDPTSATRRHGGQVTDQSSNYVTPAEFNFYSGDSYFRSRTVPISETGVATFNVQDLNVVDFYISAVSSISGRPSVIDINAKETFFPATIRFSQDIQPNTDINRLNRFFADNFIDGDSKWGTMKRIVVNGNQLEIFQELKTGYSPLFSEIGVDASGTEVLLNTQVLLNKIRYYSGDFGIGNAKFSLYKRNYSIFFCDPIHGAVLRLSQDGLTNLSEVFNFNSWSIDNLPLRNDDNIIGGFDQKLNNYIFSLEAVTGSDAITRSFSEDEKYRSLESRLSFIPEAICTLGTLLVTYKNGNTYTHDGSTYNNFYGVQYPCSITVVWNDNALIKKKYLSVGYQSRKNIKWASPENGDILTSTVNEQTGFDQISQLKERDYDLQETVLCAAFLCDANSMSDARLALVTGDYLGGNYMVQKFVCPATSTSELVNIILPYINYIVSQRNL